MTVDADVVGKPALGIQEDQLIALIRLVAFAARRVRRLALAGDGENDLSRELMHMLFRLQERFDIREVEFFPEASLFDVARRRRSRLLGRIDIKVKYRHHFARHNAYFGIECKLITPADHAQARYYVKGGVAKFADSRYSTGHPAGMILAYLMDPPVASVVDDLEKRIMKAHPGSSSLTRWNETYWTEQIAEGELPREDAAPLRLLHVFVPMWRLR